MTYHACKALDMGMNLGDQGLEEAAAAPNTVCEGPERIKSDSTRLGSILTLSRVSGRRLGIVALDLKFC